jgi:hypothetical protein
MALNHQKHRAIVPAHRYEVMSILGDGERHHLFTGRPEFPSRNRFSTSRQECRQKQKTIREQPAR